MEFRKHTFIGASLFFKVLFVRMTRMRRFIKKQYLFQALADVIKNKDEKMLSICYEVAQYHQNAKYKNAKKIKNALSAYQGWMLCRVNVLFTLVALVLLNGVSHPVRMRYMIYMTGWLLILMIHYFYENRQFQKALPYICIDELYCRKILKIKEEK